MEWIDSHCHLQSFQSRNELDAVLGRAKQAGVTRFITVGTSPEDWVPYREMHAAYTGVIDYTVGLHPCHVEEGWEDALGQLAAFFMPPHAPVALGEIGLDYFHLPKDPVQAGEVILAQEAAFRQQLLLAAELDCPVIIHSRNCFEESLHMIDESGVDWERIVFHCFSYGPEEVRQINVRGGRASFTGIASYKSAQAVREAVSAQGIERLMLETDCPYLTPEPHRGKSNEPAYLPHIAEHCAKALSMDTAALAGQTTHNTKSFFNLG
ncbi:MAG: TatD family hydrolase [Opitutales bacterium]